MNTSSTPKRTDLVLVGAGHTHIQVLESFAMDPPPGVRTTLVVDTPIAMYSGMVPGFVAGQYQQRELEIDALPLARRVGARVVIAKANALDPRLKQVFLEDRPPIRYDVASFDIGSTVAGLETPGVREHAIPTRPIGKFVVRVDRILERLGPPGDEPKRVLVVGGGAGGVELAFAMRHRLRRQEHATDITLVESGDVILPGYSKRMRARVKAAARKSDIRMLTETRVRAVQSNLAQIESPDGSSKLAYDMLLWVTGATGQSLFEDSNLATDDRGFVRVRSTLQLEAHEDVFAAGDCSTLSRHPATPKAGVYAVRQGPVLTENLRRAASGKRSLESYHPQSDFLTLINTGDGRAIGAKWFFAFEGNWVFSLKDHIDRKFMHRFQPLEPDSPRTAFDAQRMSGRGAAIDPAEMPCGGCAAKLGQSSLERALARLAPPLPDDRVELGLVEADDASCTVAPEGQRIVSSADQFRAFTDDPYLVGRIGAVNSASDVIAKGVVPCFAHALVALPEALDRESREEVLFQLMAGARSAFDAMNISLVGGHTTTATELLVGFHVEGYAESDQPLLRLDRLEAGRSLLLTKPLGTGIVLRGDMLGRARGPWFEAAVESMAEDNRAAARIALDGGARAATDVTGFGLAGHLNAMLRASGVSAVIDLEALPLLPGALELSTAGLTSTFYEENRAAEREMKIPEDIRRHPHFPLLFDPQTAGGLLFDLPPAAVDEALERLTGAGYRAATVGTTAAYSSRGARLEVIAGSARPV